MQIEIRYEVPLKDLPEEASPDEVKQHIDTDVKALPASAKDTRVDPVKSQPPPDDAAGIHQLFLWAVHFKHVHGDLLNALRNLFQGINNALRIYKMLPKKADQKRPNMIVVTASDGSELRYPATDTEISEFLKKLEKFSSGGSK
jgi:hypothetical protein